MTETVNTTLRIGLWDGPNAPLHPHSVLTPVRSGIRAATWRVEPVAAATDRFEATGPGAEQLKHWMQTGSIVDGADLMAAIKACTQLVWCQLAATKAPLRIRVLDGEVIEMVAAEPGILARLQKTFPQARLTAHPAGTETWQPAC